MMTVHEVSRLTGVSVRTLQYYDRIGLLKPAEYTEAGYRLYDGAALEKLRQILLFRELGFLLKDIREIVESPGFDSKKALDQQIALLELRRDRLESIIGLAREMRDGEVAKEVKDMDFEPFDTKKIDEYAGQAKASWGETPAFAEYERKSKGRTAEEQNALADELMDIFREFGAIKDAAPDSAEARALVRKLQDHITENYYTCSDEVLASLGQLYASGGDFTKNINAAAGEGAAEFAAKAIAGICRR